MIAYLTCPVCGFAVTGVDVWAARALIQEHYRDKHASKKPIRKKVS